MIKLKNYYYNYILIFIGLAVVSWIIWARFIRPRVPKDIPFELTEKWFFILIYICIIYFYMVYKLIRPGIPNDTVNLIIEIIYTPLVTFDEFIKNHKYIKPKYLKTVDKTVTFIGSYKEVSEQLRIIKRIYLIFYILPRTILVSILCIDTFYFHKLELIYKIILIGVIPLFHRYIKYSIKYIKDQYIKDLKTKYNQICLWDKNWTKLDWEYNAVTMLYHDTLVSVDEYIKLKLEIQQMDDPKIEYISEPLCKGSVYAQYRKNKYKNENTKLTEEDREYLDKDFHKFIPIILDLSLFLKNYSDVDYIYLKSKATHILIKHVKIIIFSLYGICWTYILYKSYHMIPYPFVDTLYTLIITLPALEEPFAGDLIIYL